MENKRTLETFQSFSERMKKQRVIKEEEEKAGKQDEYTKFFKTLLKKYDVNSPADLTDDKKKDFFDEISKGWNKGKGLTSSGEKVIDESVNESTDINEKKTNMPKKDSIVTLNKNINLISLADLKGQKLTVTGTVKTGLISIPNFLTVKDENGKEHEINPEYVSESAIEEGNAFTAALKKAKEDGDDEFEVDDETYKVEEYNDSTEITNEDSQKDQIKFYKLIKPGDEVIYNSKDKNGFKKGQKYTVDNVKSNASFQHTVVLKDGNKKLIINATNGVKPLK